MPDGVSAWERRLVARIEAGDDTALAAAYDQYNAVVFGVAARLVDRETAADVCQDVFMTLWNRPDRWNPERGSLRTFLVVIARRRSIDHVRSALRRHANEERASTSASGVAPHVDEAALAMIAGMRVRAALSALPDAQRRVIELAYFDGLTFRQVAEATGTREGTAKSRIRLGLRHLAAVLNQGGEVTTA